MGASTLIPQLMKKTVKVSTSSQSRDRGARREPAFSSHPEASRNVYPRDALAFAHMLIIKTIKKTTKYSRLPSHNKPQRRTLQS